MADKKPKGFRPEYLKWLAEQEQDQAEHKAVLEHLKKKRPNESDHGDMYIMPAPWGGSVTLFRGL
jgi:hypothetical protein